MKVIVAVVVVLEVCTSRLWLCWRWKVVVVVMSVTATVALAKVDGGGRGGRGGCCAGDRLCTTLEASL